MSVSGRMEVTNKLKVGMVHRIAITMAKPDATGEEKMSFAFFPVVRGFPAVRVAIIAPSSRASVVARCTK